MAETIRNKGSQRELYADRYVVLDIETTGFNIYKDEIIEIAALRVEQGNVTDSFQRLIKPSGKIPEDATAINHITNEMVAQAPTLDEVMGEFISFCGSELLLGFNLAFFDLNMLYDAAKRILGTELNNDYVDLLPIARKVMKGRENYSLNSLCETFEIDTEGEHRALKDCYLTKAVYEVLNERYGAGAFPELRDGELVPVRESIVVTVGTGAKKSKLTLRTGQVCSGISADSDEETQIRRYFKFPLTKPMVYYPDKEDAASKKVIRTFEFTELYDFSDVWCTVRLVLVDGCEAMIHTMFLAEMQKADFIE